MCASLSAHGSEASSLSQSATEDLIRCCYAAQWRPNIEEVRQYVLQGANICELAPFSATTNNINAGNDSYSDNVANHAALVSSCCIPILLRLIKAKSTESVVCSLYESTLSSLDFTLTDEEGNTPFHAMCHPDVDDKDTAAMMQAFVFRVETHPEDLVDWSQKTGFHREKVDPKPWGEIEKDTVNPREGFLSNKRAGKDIVQIAASSQKLSVVWPLISQQPRFDDLLHPISLESVWMWDWKELTHVQQALFSLEDAEIIVANRSTGKLVASCEASHWKVDPAVVYRWVQEGADVCFSDIHMRMPLLHRLIVSGNVEAVRVCCTMISRAATNDCGGAQHRIIDWTVGDVEGNTPLHILCSLSCHDSEIVARILHIVLDRLQKMSSKCFRSLPVAASAAAAFSENALRHDSPPYSKATENTEKHEDLSSLPSEDIVDFLRENKHGESMFSLAAAFGHLANVWKILKERGVAPFPLLLSSDESDNRLPANSYATKVKRKIKLGLRLHDEANWDKIPLEDKCFFVRTV